MTIHEERDVLLTSEYIDILYSVISQKKSISLVKFCLFAFVIKQTQGYLKPFYPAITKNDSVLRTISMIGGSFSDFINDHQFIFAAIDLAANAEKVSINNGVIRLLTEVRGSHSFDPFILKAISDSDRFTDRQFAKEIVKHV